MRILILIIGLCWLSSAGAIKPSLANSTMGHNRGILLSPTLLQQRQKRSFKQALQQLKHTVRQNARKRQVIRHNSLRRQLGF